MCLSATFSHHNDGAGNVANTEKSQITSDGTVLYLTRDDFRKHHRFICKRLAFLSPGRYLNRDVNHLLTIVELRWITGEWFSVWVNPKRLQSLALRALIKLIGFFASASNRALVKIVSLKLSKSFPANITAKSTPRCRKSMDKNPNKRKSFYHKTFAV